MSKIVYLILALALFIRFYNIEKLTTFSGDQGYDFLQIKGIIDGNLTLLGPKIGPYNELGNLYLGPAYYYLLAPSLYIANLDPIGPAIETSIFSTLTVAIIFLFSKKFLEQRAAILASALFAFNPFIIKQSRASSNPHLIPLFSILTIYSLFSAIFDKKRWVLWSLMSGAFCSIVFQLHYQGAILLIASQILLFIKGKIKAALIFLLGFCLFTSGQIIFELKHNFFISKLVIEQLTHGKTTTDLARIPLKFLESSSSIFKLFDFQIIILFVALLAILTTSKVKIIQTKNAHFVLAFLFLLSLSFLILMSLYSADINPHYFSTVYPAIFILAGLLLSVSVSSKNYVLKSLALIVIISYFLTSLISLDLNSAHGYTMPEGWNLKGQKKAANIILAEGDSNEQFNVASVLDGDTRAMPIRYLVSAGGQKPMGVEEYPNSQAVFLLTRDSEREVSDYQVYEVSSLKPFNVINLGEIQNGIYLYKLKRI